MKLSESLSQRLDYIIPKVTFALVVLMLGTGVTTCIIKDNERRAEWKESRTELHELWRTTHRPIRRSSQSNTTSQESSMSGFFVFGTGMLNGNSKTQSHATVTFAFLEADGVYTIETFPLDKVRVDVNDRIEIPTVRFQMASYKGRCCDPTKDWTLWDRIEHSSEIVVRHVILSVHPDQWNPQYEMPMDK